MTQDEKLDYIIRRLDQLSYALDPMPGYRQGPDAVWRNKATGESIYDEQQRAAIGLNPHGQPPR
jgi:hypothetical protein